MAFPFTGRFHLIIWPWPGRGGARPWPSGAGGEKSAAGPGPWVPGSAPRSSPQAPLDEGRIGNYGYARLGNYGPDSETTTLDSETTTAQRLGNYPAATRKLKAYPPRLGNYHCPTTRKPTHHDSETSLPATRKLHWLDSETMVAARKLLWRLGNCGHDSETIPLTRKLQHWISKHLVINVGTIYTG